MNIFLHGFYFLTILTKKAHHGCWAGSSTLFCRELLTESVARCSTKKGVLKNFAKFMEKYRYHSLFSNKVAGVRPEILMKKGFRRKCFPVLFAKCLTTSFFYRTQLVDPSALKSAIN